MANAHLKYTLSTQVQGVYFYWTLIIINKNSHIAIGTNGMVSEGLKDSPTIHGKSIIHDHFKPFK